MKKRKMNWGVVGLVMSELLGLFKIIRDIFERMNVGIEIVPWLCGEGKETFVKGFLEPLAQKFIDGQRIRVVDDNTILVNLGASPKRPFASALIETHVGAGWVEVQKRVDGLYVGDRKVVFYLSEGQYGNRYTNGYNLRAELTGKDILNANILDALLEHTYLIPEDWKENAEGQASGIYFWATIYQNAEDSLCVRYLHFDRRSCWRASYFRLSSSFGANDLAVVRAS